MTAPAIEWVYTYPKSMIAKVFDQPNEALALMKNKEPIYRQLSGADCLFWDKSKEGFAFWETFALEVSLSRI